MPQDVLEQLGTALSRSDEDIQRRLKDYAVQLAEDVDSQDPEREKLHRDVRTEIISLKKTAAHLKRSQRQAAIAADELDARLHDVENFRKKPKFFIRSAPANAVIDLEEVKSRHFARGLNFYKLFLLCFIGSFVGVVLELFWCLISNGYLESRSGLVYGPFNLLYGAGAVALTLALYRYRNRSFLPSFIGGMVVGSVVEYVCSWGQELILGSRSWDYSDMPFNLNGRICLLYSVFWGVLGVLWIKNIYPRMAKWILRIPNKAGKIITWVLVAFMVINAAVTAAAVYRWSERSQGNGASNALEAFIDERFPDKRMERIFANMEFNTDD